MRFHSKCRVFGIPIKLQLSILDSLAFPLVDPIDCDTLSERTARSPPLMCGGPGRGGVSGRRRRPPRPRGWPEGPGPPNDHQAPIPCTVGFGRRGHHGASGELSSPQPNPNPLKGTKRMATQCGIPFRHKPAYGAQRTPTTQSDQKMAEDQ